ncbi:DUF1904 family protein [Paenibacillus agricola]|uniref:DUF1904 family protein n=1 Tax=Paenibacillus agricola TaxID=2716264 RepID=A0ABX0J6D6_9BACL|nr:DUF1904 family protein [Paenibacillus agricola]NHN31919.1 DUF1904 family protein [Paenibacillus agricola]
MPYLRFKGFPKPYLQTIAPRIATEFSQLVGVTQEMVKIELLLTETITAVPHSLEILMFPRQQEVHDAVAATINQILRESGYHLVHIFFIILDPHVYYKHGEPLALHPAKDDTV